MIRFLMFVSSVMTACTTFATSSETPTAKIETAQGESAFDLKKQVEEYKLRYGLRDTDSKLVDNRGDGYEALYGLRNFRTVLHGVYYRGGGNNSYNRYGKRDNMNPLPKMGLENLCEQGFSDSVYLYEENFGTAPKNVACRTIRGDDSAVDYQQETALAVGSERKMMKRIYDHIKGVRKGPIYAHCWNGWHASGFVAAIALRQFCKMSGDDADAYWVRNTDGDSEGRPTLRARIKNFKPFTEFAISQAEQDLICP